MCVREREGVCERERDCVCVRDRVCVCESEKEIGTRIKEGEDMEMVRVYLCVLERDGEREFVSVRK